MLCTPGGTRRFCIKFCRIRICLCSMPEPERIFNLLPHLEHIAMLHHPKIGLERFIFRMFLQSAKHAFFGCGAEYAIQRKTCHVSRRRRFLPSTLARDRINLDTARHPRIPTGRGICPFLRGINVASLYRILVNVVELLRKIKIIPDCVFPKISLPQTPSPIKKTVDLKARSVFPIAHDVRNCADFANSQKQVHVIWHEDKTMEKKGEFCSIEIQVAKKNRACGVIGNNQSLAFRGKGSAVTRAVMNIPYPRRRGSSSPPKRKYPPTIFDVCRHKVSLIRKNNLMHKNGSIILARLF